MFGLFVTVGWKADCESGCSADGDGTLDWEGGQVEIVGATILANG